MAAAATKLLALWALLTGSSADNHCTTKTYGSLNGVNVQLRPVPLQPGYKDWQIDSPVSEACAVMAGYAVGVMVTACDPEGPPPPIVNILSLPMAKVKRNTYAMSSGIAYVTAYCMRNYQKDVNQQKMVGEDGGVEGVEVVGGIGEVGDNGGVRVVDGAGGAGVGVSRNAGMRASVVGVGGRGVLTAVPLK